MVSIVMPCRNERPHIEHCIRSLLAQDPPIGGFEVIVADGMSDDGTRDILAQLAREHPQLRVIDNPKLIVSSGLNAAIRESRGRIILRMDAHTEYSSDYIRNCLEVLQSTGADSVGGPWIAKSTGLIGMSIAAAFHSPFSFGGTRGHNRNYEGPVDTVYLGCWSRQLFDRIGFFDEELIRNQDDEFNLRLMRSGGTIWQSPRIRSCYKPRGTLAALFRQYEQYGYWKVKVIQKHKLPASYRHLVPAAFILSLLVLPLAFSVFPISITIWWSLIGLYGVCNLTASILAAAQNGWRLLLVLPITFACFHFGYGVGFLRGIWDLVILKREPSSCSIRLTR
jgi:glycosyltransferase involved in cell wall biosynthesis